MVASVDGLLIKEEKTNMFGVGAFMEEFHRYWLLGNYLYFEIWLYFHLCVQIHLLNGRPMKANF